MDSRKGMKVGGTATEGVVVGGMMERRAESEDGRVGEVKMDLQRAMAREAFMT